MTREPSPCHPSPNGEAVITIYDNNWTPEDPSDDVKSKQKIRVKVADGIAEIVEVIK